MRRFIRKASAAFMLAALCLASSGCGSFRFAVSPEELYQLPQLPPEYTALNSSISDLLSGGEEYAAPVSGSNTQSVQMVDLDGDGQEEALAFLRNSAAEKPLKIHIFDQDGDGYRQTALIEGSGASIYSVAYRDLNGDGVQEILVGWKVAADLQALSVYSLRGHEPVELAQTGYVKYAVINLDSSRPEMEVVVLHADDEGSGTADLYAWQRDGGPGTLVKASGARLSMTMAELNSGRVVPGTLRDGTPALFVSGVSDTGEEITDVLAVKEGELANIVLSDVTGVTTELFRFLSLFPSDINGDGVTEAPRPDSLLDMELSSGGDIPLYRCVDWRSFDLDGAAETELWTYHNIEDGWYLRLPEEWLGRITVERTVAAGESAITFSALTDGGGAFLRLTAISGSNREQKAQRNGRFVLSRRDETVYTGELPGAGEGRYFSLTEDEVRAAFSLIAAEWSAGDY